MQSTGSSFAAVAIQQWVGQTSTLYGLNINWQVQSSVVGLNDFAQNQVDFGASDIPYSSQQAQSTPTFPYQYMPDVAGGLSFMYNLNGNDGQRINSLEINASVIDKIFLGEITTWNDPAIAQINPQLVGDLPNTKIVPVFRTDASGENYLLSDYLLHQDGANFTAAQHAFQAAGHPRLRPAERQLAHPDARRLLRPEGLPGVGGRQSGGPERLGQRRQLRVVPVEPGVDHLRGDRLRQGAQLPGGLPCRTRRGSTSSPPRSMWPPRWRRPILHTDLTQDLTNVYTNPLPNAYPLSAYSYLVTPCSPSLGRGPGHLVRGPAGPVDRSRPQKGQALGQFVDFMACAGQQQMATLGYSPLPPNLVQEDFNAIGRLNGGVQAPEGHGGHLQEPLRGRPDPAARRTGRPRTDLSDLRAAAATPADPGDRAAREVATGGSDAAGARAPAARQRHGRQRVRLGRAAGGSTKGLTAAQVAAGYRVVNGHIVKSLDAGPSKYVRADALISASKGIDGIPVPELLVWVLVALLLFLGIPLFGSYRKRRSGHRRDPSESRPEAAR